MKKSFPRLFLIFWFIVQGMIVYSQPYSLTDSLIAVYKFEGNALDSTSNHNDGIVHGATLTTDRFGNVNGAYSFNGTSDYIELIPGNSKFKPTTFPISVCAWIKYNGPDNGQLEQGVSCVFMNDLKENEYHGIWLNFSLTGRVAISYGTGGTSDPSTRRSKAGTTNVSDNQWHFVAGVIRGPLAMDLYVDCKSDGGTYSGSGGTITYSTNNGTMGKIDPCSAGCDPFYYYKGAIDEIRFYHRELTQDDIYRLYKISNNPFPSISLGADQIFCQAGSLTLTPTYSNGSKFLWSNNSTASSISVISEGNYSVTLTDDNGCKASDSKIITFSTILPLSISGNPLVCRGKSTTLIANGADTYTWAPSIGLSDTRGESISASPSTDVTYTVTGMDAVGCSGDTTVEIKVLPSPVINMQSNISIPCGSSGVKLTPEISGASSFHWQNAPGMQLKDTSSNSPFVSPEQKTTYTLWANTGQCEAEASVVVQLGDAQVFLPNAFSPNGDGLNDIFKLISLCGFQLDYFRIYNRWGEKIFETTFIDLGWDGTYKGKVQEVGVFVYVVSGNGDNDKRIFLKGNVTLLR